MSKTLFDKNINYTKRFLKKHSRRLKLPQAKYLDAKFHPKYKDHVVVLSKINCPQNVKMNYIETQTQTNPVWMSQDQIRCFPDEFIEAVEQTKQLITQEQ